MNMQVLQRDRLPLGGFAGIREHRLVVDNRIGGNNKTWNGIGGFVYLADAKHEPRGESKMHSHNEIDVISVIIDGRVDHEGSMRHGQSLIAGQAQAQRAGGEGFSHNEINPENNRNRMIQLWVLPETKGQPASYKFYNLKQNQLTRIYGGSKYQNATLDSHTIMEVGLLSNNHSISKNGEFLLYFVKGKAQINGKEVQEGDLVHDVDLIFKGLEDSQIILITTKEKI